MKSNQGNFHSFDFMNDQENSDIQDELQNISDPSASHSMNSNLQIWTQPSSTDALHIWAENALVDEHNQKKLEAIHAPLFILKAKDQYPKNVNKQDIDRALARGRSETGGLEFESQIKEGARIMLTTNINIQDSLINGQMGTVVRIQVNDGNEPKIVFIKFDDENAGKTMRSNTVKNHAVLYFTRNEF